MAEKEKRQFRIRDISQVDSYISFNPDLYKGGRLLLVSAGESQYGYPPVVDKLLKDYVEQGVYKDLQHYYLEKNKEPVSPEDEMNPARKGIRIGFNINDEPNIFFRGGGSVQAGNDLLNLLPQDGSGALFNISPRFPYNSIFARQRGMGLAMPELPLTNTANQNLLEIMRNPGKYLIKGNQYLVGMDNPNNPFGSVANIEVIRMFAGFLYNLGHILYIDEAFGEYMPRRNSAIPLTQEYDNVIVSRTFSKGWGLPRLRAYYLVMSRLIAEQYKKIPYPFSLDSLQAYIANRLLEDPAVMDEHSEMIRRRTKEIKSLIIKEFEERNIKVLPKYQESEYFLDNPLLAIKGYPGMYYDLAGLVGIRAVSGEGFRVTHREMDDSIVRYVVPATKNDALSLVKRTDAVITKHGEGFRRN